MRIRIACVTALLVVGTSCTEPVAPIYPEVQAARAAWVRNRPANYSFEINAIRVTVVDGKAVEPKGARTLDDHWASILVAMESARLQHWKFSPDGVPLEWEVIENWDETQDPFITASYWVSGFKRQ